MIAEFGGTLGVLSVGLIGELLKEPSMIGPNVVQAFMRTAVAWTAVCTWPSAALKSPCFRSGAGRAACWLMNARFSRTSLCWEPRSREAATSSVNLLQAQLFRRQQPGVAADDYAIFVHDDGLAPAELRVLSARVREACGCNCYCHP